MPESPAIYVMVGNRQTATYSNAWRIWWGRTSFYLKPKASELSRLKISLHGPDPEHGDSSYYKLEEDTTASAEGGMLVTGQGGLPLKFRGNEVAKGVRHVITLRSSWDMFQPGVPSAQVTKPKSKNTALMVPAPAAGLASDVEIYVSERGPFFWEDENQIRAVDAAVGPIENPLTGHVLTGVSYMSSLFRSPGPASVRFPDIGDEEPSTRGIAFGVDEKGVLWLCDQIVPAAAALEDGSPLVPWPHNWLALSSPTITLARLGHLVRNQAASCRPRSLTNSS